MQLWPFVPAEEMVESLEWSSDVIRGKSAEQRIALRIGPRQSLDFRHALRPAQMARARALAFGVGVGEFGVPVWAEHTRLSSVAAGASAIVFDTTATDYRAGGYAVLWASDTACEVVSVDTVTAGGLTLAAPVQASYTAPVIMPLRVGRSPQGVKLSRAAASETQASISFDVTESADLGADPGYPQYRGHAVMTDASAIAEPLDEQTFREAEAIDNEVGIPALLPTFRAPMQRCMMRWQAFTRTELWNLRRWLHSRRGKQRGFWLPTWAPDFEVMAPIASNATQITVRAIGYPAHYGERHVMLRTAAGATYYRRVLSGAAGAPGLEILTIDAALGAAVSPAQVDRLSLLHFVRFAADRVEIRHQAGVGAFVAMPCEEVALP